MLSLWQRRSLAVGYWHHWLNAVNQHSLHAPFIYQFYQQVIAANDRPPSYSRIEQYRKKLKESREEISIPSIGAPSTVNPSQVRLVGDIARHSLSSPKFGSLLYHLVQYQSANIIVELGTSLGITTLYLAEGNPKSEVYTLEGASAVANVARQTFQEFHCQNVDLREGNIDQTLPVLLEDIPSVDIAYLDANHRQEPTLNYFHQLLAKTHEESILIFDDIHWSFGMRQAWRQICTHPRVTLSVDLFDAGLVFFHPFTTKQHYSLMF